MLIRAPRETPSPSHRSGYVERVADRTVLQLLLPFTTIYFTTQATAINPIGFVIAVALRRRPLPTITKGTVPRVGVQMELGILLVDPMIFRQPATHLSISTATPTSMCRWLRIRPPGCQFRTGRQRPQVVLVTAKT